MKIIQFIKHIINLFTYPFFLIYGYKTHCKVNKILNVVYSSWLIHENWGRIGRNIIFTRPVTLIGINNIYIGDNTCFGKGCVISAWKKYHESNYIPKIDIGDSCHFGEYNHITSINYIKIGNNVLTGRWITITDNAHGDTKLTRNIPPIKRQLYSKGGVEIGNNVWIGDKVTILPGIIIGDNCIIGANSVVTQNIPSNSIAVGNPIRIIEVKQ